jgi:hypothetical protein
MFSYANDEGYTMMAPRVTPEQMREERLAAMRGAPGGGGLRDGESAKDMQIEAEKGQLHACNLQRGPPCIHAD